MKRLEDLLAELGQQSLVGRHHDFTMLDRGQDQLEAFLLAAHDLHDDVDRRILHQILKAVCEKFFRKALFGPFDRVTNRDFAHLHVEPYPFPQEGAVSNQVLVYTCANVSKAG